MNVNPNNPSPLYSNNSLIKPLIKFHGKVISTFESLPTEGKALEIAKRVIIIAVSPFVYLGLGLLALVGLAFNSSLHNRAVRNAPPHTPLRPAQNPTSLISVASECNKIQQQVISTINQARSIDQIQSAKIFMDIECGSKKFSKDVIIKKLEGSCLDRDFLAQAVDRILSEAKDNLGIQNTTDKFNFNWAALLKDRNGIFHGANGSRDSSGIENEVDSNHLQEYFNLVLEGIGRQARPQLNTELNFI